MSVMSIEVNTCSATLYNGTAAVGAHAGNSFSIEKWILEQQQIIGKCAVSGWHRLIALRSKEKEAAADNTEATAQHLTAVA